MSGTAIRYRRFGADRRSASASASVVRRELLTGPYRRLTVAGVFPAAVYLATPETGRIQLALVAHDGIAQPNALVLNRSVADHPFVAAHAGQSVGVGERRVAAPWGDIEVARWWDPTPVLPRVDATSLHAATRIAAGLIDDQARPLPEPEGTRFVALTGAIAASETDQAMSAAAGLLGLGAGLTPTGDDLLAGLIAAVALLAPTVAGVRAKRLADDTDRVASEVVDRSEAMTTALSGALLRHARHGEICRPAAVMVSALSAGAPHDRLAGAVGGLLAVGASSGRDLALGLLAGARLLTDDVAPATSIPPLRAWRP